MGNIYAIGLPSVVMVAIGSVMTFCMNKILITYHSAKETAATAFGIYFKLNSFVFMPVFGLNNGCLLYTSPQRHAAGGGHPADRGGAGSASEPSAQGHPEMCIRDSL